MFGSRDLYFFFFFFFQAEDGIRDRSPSRGLGDVYKRQVHLERFVCCLKIKKEQEWKIRLTDSLVPENNGYFIIKTGIEGGSLIRVENLSEKEKKMFCSMDIGQLTEELFRLPVFLNEVV